MSDAFTAKSGSLWVMPYGPNVGAYYLGCVDAGDITEPQGDTALVQCFDPNGDFKTVGETITPQGPVTADLTQLTSSIRSYLERIQGEYGLIFLERDSGRADNFTNWRRALILQQVNNTSKTYSNVVMREADNPSTRGFAISATPPVIQVQQIAGHAVGGDVLTEKVNVTGIAMLKEDNCIYPAKYGMAVCDADKVAHAKACVYYTDDGGHIWTLMTNLPFDVDEDIAQCTIVDMGNGVIRCVAANYVGLELAYTDDFGATAWTVITLPDNGYKFFTLDAAHSWLACYAGYILFSSDGWATFVAQEDGTLSAGDIYENIAFHPDGLLGYAVGDTNIAKTIDGGDSWFNVTFLPGAPSSLAVAVKPDTTVFVGDDNGNLWYSNDGGTTWIQRTGFYNDGIGQGIFEITFLNDYVGFILEGGLGASPALLRTIDGGKTWQVVEVISEYKGYCMYVCDENYVLVGGTQVIAPTLLGYIRIFEE